MSLRIKGSSKNELGTLFNNQPKQRIIIPLTKIDLDNLKKDIEYLVGNEL
ncbi:hypothetical protein Xind_03072 [Xenorhabdus indica]|nr:hypothetical protein [Xenorhabdus indica]